VSGGLQLRDVRVGRRLGPIDADLPHGRLTVVVGPNGAGKSTLLGVIAGLVRPDRGRVALGDRDVLAMRAVERAAHIAWLPQSPRVEDGVTAVEAVAAARYRHREGGAERLEQARASLARLGLEAFADRPMRSLSGGEAQRVRLAALVAQGSTWWLLDEPMNHLDPAVRLDLCHVLGERVSQGTSVVVVSHDLSLLPHLGDAHVVVLKAGTVAHVGEARDPALLGPLGEAFGLRLHRVELADGWALVPAGRT